MNVRPFAWIAYQLRRFSSPVIAKTWECQNLSHLLTEHIHSLFGLLIREPGIDGGYGRMGVVEDLTDHLDGCPLLS